MRTIAAAAVALAVMSAAQADEPCRVGTNRPAIDTMDRNITPGGTVIRCVQRPIQIEHPDGTSSRMKMWSFEKVGSSPR